MAKIVMETSNVWIDEKKGKMIFCPTLDDYPVIMDQLVGKGWERMENPYFVPDPPYCVENKGGLDKYFVKVEQPEDVFFPAQRLEKSNKTMISVNGKCTFENITVPWGGKSTGSRYGRVICK